jgi:nucleotide-binding universal stress UspA family protein
VKEVDMSTTAERNRALPVRTSAFSRILVGVDGSDEAIEAARQAAIFAEGPLTLLTVYDIASSILGGAGTGVPAHLDEDLQRTSASEALDQARQALAASDAVAGMIVRGSPWDALIEEIHRARDTLVAVGSHGTGRARGILIGSTATELLHKSPCSVLVTRGRAHIPRRIVVGVDGSPESARAYAAARDLAERFDSHLRTIVDHGGKPVDMDLVRAIAGDRAKETMHEPVRALVGASGIVDLVVVGSRGLHGLKALGSISERVAHQALCSVLVVREAPWQRPEEPEVDGE